MSHLKSRGDVVILQCPFPLVEICNYRDQWLRSISKCVGAIINGYDPSDEETGPI